MVFHKICRPGNVVTEVCLHYCPVFLNVAFKNHRWAINRKGLDKWLFFLAKICQHLSQWSETQMATYTRLPIIGLTRCWEEQLSVNWLAQQEEDKIPAWHQPVPGYWRVQDILETAGLSNPCSQGHILWVGVDSFAYAHPCPCLLGS